MKRRNLLMATGAVIASPATVQATSGDSDEEIVDYLFVQTSDTATLSASELKLGGINPSTLYFSDRPERIVGRIPTQEFVDTWGKGTDNFKSDPPNAVLTLHDPGQLIEVTVELSEPRIGDGALIYSVKILEGEPVSSGSGASLFIDLIGRPLTPVSFAGTNRRTRRRVRRRWAY